MDDDYEDYETRSMRFMKVDILPLVLGLVEGIAGALHAAAVTAYNVAARHANYAHEQEAFRQEASLEIETIIAESTDG